MFINIQNVLNECSECPKCSQCPEQNVLNSVVLLCGYCTPCVNAHYIPVIQVCLVFLDCQVSFKQETEV